ncbi:MAG: AAA family ATPase [Myxococcota bacterium]
MSLQRDLTVWITQRTLAGGLTVASPLLRSSLGWPAATVETVAAALAEALQDGLWKGDSVLEALAAFPALTLHTTESLLVTLPEVRGIKGTRPAIEIGVRVVILQAMSGLLAVAPSLALSWPGESAEAAREGLRARITLHLLSREAPLDGEALVELLAVTAATAEPVSTALALPTANEVRDRAKQQARLIDTVLPPLQTVEAYGLEPELAALVRAMGAGRSVVVVGPHGVGKTALVRELVRSRAAEVEANLTVRETTAPQLLMRLLDAEGGGWQDALARLSTELAASRDWLYVGRIAELFEVGRYEGNSISIGESLAPSVQRGDVRLLGEATPEELARLDARYPGMLDGLVRLPFPEPTARLEDIVSRWGAARGRALGVVFRPDAIREILRLQRRFAPYSGFPGRSIRFLEGLATDAAAAASVDGADGQSAPVVELGRDAVLDRYCAESGLPRALVDPRTPLSYPAIRAHFDARIFGQPEAVTAVCDALATVTADVARAGKPLVSMLLVGPTGVGKTEMARALATFLFGDPRRMIRFDMSEYASPAAVLRLVEGPEGDGQLTGAVRRQPFAVILLDELEKAHPAVLDLLLQVLGEGRLTDGSGVAADFCSTVILMTSNVGSAEAKRGATGFDRDGAAPTRLAAFQEAVRGWLRPELLNRIDRVLAFAPLTPEAVERVLTRELAAFAQRPGLRGRAFTVTPDARARLATAGYHPTWGARQLLRAVHDHLAAPTAAALDAWKDPMPADVRVADGLRIELVRGSKRGRDTALDALHALAQARRRSLANVLDGSAYAELDASEQANRRREEERREARGGRAEAGGASSLGRDLLERLQSLAADALQLEMDLGVAALGEAPPTAAGFAGPLDTLDRAALSACQDLYDRVHPEARSAVVAVYGLDTAPVDDLVAHYRALAVRWRITVESAALHLHDGALELFLPGAKLPDRVGERVGVELLVTGPAAALLFASEAGVHRFVSTTGRDGAVRVLVHPGTRESWATPRPADPDDPGPPRSWITPRPTEPHRRHFFAAPPRRVFRGAVEDREEKWTIEGVSLLRDHLSGRFAARLVEGLG